MRPVDNFFGTAVGALVDQRCRVSSRGGVCSGVAIHPVGDLSAIAGTTSNAGGARPRNGLRCGCPRETSQTSTGGFLQRIGREPRMGMVDEPVADRGDRHLSPSLCFVTFDRLKNLAQNHFRNVSASCAADPCWSLLNAPAAGTWSEG